MERNKAEKAAKQELRSILTAIGKQKWLEQQDTIRALAEGDAGLSELVLLHLLDSRSPNIRDLALTTLADCNSVLGRIAARALLDDAHAMVRNAAAETLGQFGTGQDVRRLCHALADKDWVTRATAADSLGAVGGKAAHPALKQAMTGDPHPVVRRDAAIALSYARRDEVVPELEQALAAETEEQARVGLLEALYALGREEYLINLLTLLHSEDSSVRYAVIHSLTEIVRSDDKAQAVQAIRAMLLQEENPGLQIDAATAAQRLSHDVVID